MLWASILIEIWWSRAQICFQIELNFRIVNFVTLDPRRSPRCLQGAPKSRMDDPCPIVRVDFEVIFDARIDQISSQFKITKKLTSERGFWWKLSSLQDGQPWKNIEKQIENWRFSIFDSSASREQFSGMRLQNEVKMTSKMTPEWRRIRGQESMSK